VHLQPRRDRALPAALSGPLLDRIDLHVYVRPVPLAELRRSEPGESSAAIRARVVAARDRQLVRLRPWNLRCNAVSFSSREATNSCPQLILELAP
jgi:predicted ATPase with chaperone activity